MTRESGLEHFLWSTHKGKRQVHRVQIAVQKIEHRAFLLGHVMQGDGGATKAYNVCTKYLDGQESCATMLQTLRMCPVAHRVRHNIEPYDSIG